jgi:carotenoid cleavage dioxygenase-like enzyme
VRYVIDLESKTVIERIAMRYDRTPDFPSVDGALTGSRYEDFWMLGMQHSGVPGRKFFDEVVHGSWKQGECNDVYALPPGEYLGGEPVLIANPKDHGEAVVIVQHLQPATDQAAFVVLDAFNVKSGPIARIPLRDRLHPGFHASFWRA